MMTGKSAPRRLSIFGSTGSIGQNTLNVVDHLGGRENFEISVLTGSGNVELLARQAKSSGARLAVTANDRHYESLKSALSGTGIAVASGKSGLMEAADREADWVMAAIVGTAGLAPTLAAARRGADIALANKECLVSAGDLFIAAIREGGGKLLPVDSEHNAIFQVLEENQRHAVERVILTASGGPFRTASLRDMADVTVETARAHPNWSMGLKISIDSASMFNKALEMIEARHLFGLSPEQIEVIFHPQSIIHSMVGYTDGSVLAQLGAPDMRTAIGYALSFPRRPNLPVERLDFAKLARLDFEAPDEVRFPALRLARLAMTRGGVQGAVLNGAKEVALEAFIEGQLSFLAMAEVTERVMDDLAGLPPASSMDDVFAADREARQRAAELMTLAIAE
ncbi:1-deoxy-D-xylulose-5-phosphate reductoisomerase [Rhizobium johnstonii]|uniref:1-deoxy-D-xylulose-5-phosphate reductoisomerase n=1 Tax=Rhizobium TaxID=379 RepID=UPI0010318458|nr:1-deoxy-D-xylulose-5-phosphate reductoisomerase [Rhizobium leguminosarum]TBF84608.1 1-deoxy-D-xylulose-5-phosphate reductoisomerase [Rhizobium leguminosarum]TBH04053.1 1-deoxy-D-xylulose-5-phosphate reductoisomerase [Rhizobium leguminosarum]TBH13480.1 1-deoxy-D-xylulose-5-phosphate reductoisomerase [Rhizobium leguminosarum]TBH38532.1 1-deoxy-D-xylulose-5-phosphate reductoisomerase [Rhizobium leguminosarum]TBH68743.1 1-deoxy-D-xylulose-5-phosphate reductoisomerase [Rhizobium leguminosarum]